MLEDLYLSSNQFTQSCKLIDDIRDQYIGFNLRQILFLPNFNILIIFKLLLLEGRIIVYSQNSQKLS